MDEPELKTSPYDLHDRTGADATPVKDNDRHSADDSLAAASHHQIQSPGNPFPESLHVVYCDNEQEVREGFAIALRIMRLEQK